MICGNMYIIHTYMHVSRSTSTYILSIAVIAYWSVPETWGLDTTQLENIYKKQKQVSYINLKSLRVQSSFQTKKYKKK